MRRAIKGLACLWHLKGSLISHTVLRDPEFKVLIKT